MTALHNIRYVKFIIGVGNINADRFLKCYLEELKISKSMNTVGTYDRNIHKFIDYLESIIITLDDIGTEAIEEYKNYLLTTRNTRTKKPVNAQTVNQKLVSIKGFIAPNKVGE